MLVTELFVVTAVVVPVANVIEPVPELAPSVYAAALDVSNVILVSEIVPTVRIVLPLPLPLNVAVSPTPGTGFADQFVVVAQTAEELPVQVALAA